MARLIDAEALKKEIVNSDYLSSDEKSLFLNRIDNAPTVEPEKVLVANVTFDEDKVKEIIQTEVIEKIKSGELVLKDERPQGEWVRKDDIIHLLEYWSDGYSYIEIPTDTAIKAIKEFKGGEANDS